MEGQKKKREKEKKSNFQKHRVKLVLKKEEEEEKSNFQKHRVNSCLKIRKECNITIRIIFVSESKYLLQIGGLILDKMEKI